ncbi:MAG: (d)CMP kinase, partial [Desulfobacterales bacterium]|nr:(d)CMP kinase [Desulfobacterales bacterium]
MKKRLITIDGPAGVGKTTVSRMLAERLGYRWIDTGALYRGVAYMAASRGVTVEDAAGLEALCRDLTFTFVPGEGGPRLMADGADITDFIRTPEITRLSSAFSAKPVVRERLLDLQRELGEEKEAVFEGRDMGSVVFPNADVKFFMDASLETRALRRRGEYAGDKGPRLDEVERDMEQRDHKDRTRDLAP